MDFLARFFNSDCCYLCNFSEDLLCSKCFAKLEKTVKTEYIDGYRFNSVYKYNQTASRILLMSKYPPYYFHILKHLIKMSVYSPFPINSIFCPVPLSKLKMFERKFNQADVIAKEVSYYSKGYVIPVLNRVKETRALFSLEKTLRTKEVSNAFRVSFLGSLLPKKETPKIILVDDLVTTGSTVRQCIKALNQQGFADIEVFSLFRA